MFRDIIGCNSIKCNVNNNPKSTHTWLLLFITIKVGEHLGSVFVDKFSKVVG